MYVGPIVESPLGKSAGATVGPFVGGALASVVAAVVNGVGTNTLVDAWLGRGASTAGGRGPF